MKKVALAGIACMLWSQAAWASDAPPADADSATDEAARSGIVVTGIRTESFSGTKTDTPLIETPQPITVVTEDIFRAQGAISISDTVRYAAGITANPYGRDTRVDGFTIRGIDAQQFRDGMRDIFSYYASITADPYNFSRVEIVRGPASVLFGQGSIGGLVNLVSKSPDFTTRGEVNATFGSYNRKEVMGDVNAALDDKLAVRLVARLRDADTYVEHVPDNRAMVAPSIRWRPTPDTDITLLGLYQEDGGGSTSQFLPIVGTFRPNGSNPSLDRYLFVGKPGWDRYDGRLLQGGGSLIQQFGKDIRLSMKARYIDSRVTYFTHYANSYSDLADPTNIAFPTDPYLDPAKRLIGLYSDGSYAKLNVFSTDNNLQFKFNTGAAIEHTLLAGLDYSWNRVTKQGGFGYEVIDLYNIDYNALTIPEINGDPTTESQRQFGLYLQDQIRFWDRVSVVLGVRRDRVKSGGSDTVDKAITYRAGIIGEIGAGISPFFSYTESFLPITIAGAVPGAVKPQRGSQFEVGAKWQPDKTTLVTVTAFHIKDRNRPQTGAFNVITQSGELTTEGFEVEASRILPGNFELLVNYGYNKLVAHDTQYYDYMPRHNASIWSTKSFALRDDVKLRLGAGVRYTGERTSVGPAWTIVTPANTQVDALAELRWNNWGLTVNATNLFDGRFYASCLSRGDCFMNAPRNVMGTVSYRF